MARQLSLLEAPRRTWQIDHATREVGRRGVAEARATLRAALARTAHAQPAGQHVEHPSGKRSAA